MSAEAVIITIALVGVMGSIERLIRMLSGGRLTIRNAIYITVKSPKDINITVDGREETTKTK